VGAVGVMHIIGPVPDIKDLPGLCDGTDEGIVAALALLPRVDADRRAFGEAAGGQHRVVKVQGDADQVQLGEPRQNTLTAEMAQIADTTFVQPRQRPTVGGDILQSSVLEQSQHHVVVTL